MIIAALLCILALLGLCNGLLTWWGRCLNIHELTVQLIVGYIFYPVAFLLGVERNGDLLKVSQLIGIKVVANEFVAVSSAPFASIYSLNNSSSSSQHSPAMPDTPICLPAPA